MFPFDDVIMIYVYVYYRMFRQNASTVLQAVPRIYLLYQSSAMVQYIAVYKYQIMLQYEMNSFRTRTHKQCRVCPLFKLTHMTSFPMSGCSCCPCITIMTGAIFLGALHISVCLTNVYTHPNKLVLCDRSLRRYDRILYTIDGYHSSFMLGSYVITIGPFY